MRTHPLLHKILSCVFVVFAVLPLKANEESALKDITTLLDVDRFLFYKDAWVGQFAGKKPEAITQAVSAINVDDVYAKRTLLAERLKDISNYDGLLAELATLHSSTRIELAQVEWNYNFYKRKVQEAFVVNVDRADSRLLPGLLPQSPAKTRGSTEINAAWTPDSKILLDTDQYISNRTTRAVFWDSALSGRKIEFHLGTERAFRTRLQANGARIVAEVKPIARNYNKIYLVQYPGQPEPVYAFTRISGHDRLDHLVKQLSLVKIAGKSADQQVKVRVFGDEKRISKQIEKSLVQFLERVPEADLVIIGQKGAIESHLRAGYLLEAMIELRKTSEALIRARLSEKEWAGFDALTKGLDVSADFLTDMKRVGAADRYATLLKTELTHVLGIHPGQEKIFDVENVSHDISDFVLRTNDGSTRRWRVISNVWGDEVSPIAKALARTGHKRVISIGTAGAIAGKGLKVGDLVQAKAVYIESADQTEALERPVFKVEGAKQASVGHVTTPYVETQKWLEASSARFEVIELETAYIHQALRGKSAYQSFFLISDVVGSEHESLASADSNARKKSLLNLIKTVATQEGVIGVVSAAKAGGHSLEKAASLQRRIDELAPKRALESRFQLAQAAWHADLSTDEELKVLIAKEKPFSRDLLNRTLTSAGHVVSILSEGLSEKGSSARIYLPEEFMETRWNPALGLDLLLHVDSADDEKWAKEALERLAEQNPTLKKSVRVRTTNREPEAKWLRGIMAATDSSHSVADVYANLALTHGALVSTVNTSGQLRFERVESLRVEAPKKPFHGAPFCRAAFASP